MRAASRPFRSRQGRPDACSALSWQSSLSQGSRIPTFLGRQPHERGLERLTAANTADLGRHAHLFVTSRSASPACRCGSTQPSMTGRPSRRQAPEQAAHCLAKINSKHEKRHRSVPLSFQNGAILTDRSGERRAIPQLHLTGIQGRSLPTETFCRHIGCFNLDCHNWTKLLPRCPKKSFRQMHCIKQIAVDAGAEPPLFVDGRGSPPERREVSIRWLAGTVLTGVTSSVLMGTALLAALNGHERLATPPEVARMTHHSRLSDDKDDSKTDRVVAPRLVVKTNESLRINVPMVTKIGDREIVRTVPIVRVEMTLTGGYTTRPYPSFNPFAVFSNDIAENVAAGPAAQIYGARADSELILRMIDFPIAGESSDGRSGPSASEVEKVVRRASATLNNGAIRAAGLGYVDPKQFGEHQTQSATMLSRVRIVPENVSLAPRVETEDRSPSFAEEIIPFTRERDIVDAFAKSGHVGTDAMNIAAAIGSLLGVTSLKAGTVLRVGLEMRGDAATVVRASIYDQTRHTVTVALNDRGQYVPAPEPDPTPSLLRIFDDGSSTAAHADLPSLYDGVFQAAYSEGLSKRMVLQLIKLLAANVDFRSSVNASDRLEVLFTEPDDKNRASNESQLLYLSANIGATTRSLYRFQMKDGTIGYFDGDGSNAKPFLFRKPVPSGRFTSGFGMRRHPVLGYAKMHTGTDWAAPTGTPIIAAGNGVVEKAGWARGYGYQTVVRHANGYETSYSHQRSIAKGIAPGSHVRQGQVIGYVGSTGLSTGPHLHYELIVNGSKVDPMRVRLPVERTLTGGDFAAFQRERKRIDGLLGQQGGNVFKMARTAIRLQ